MAINKVVFGEDTLIDLTADTVHPDRMYKGDTAHAADGTTITGTAEVTVEGTTLIMPEGLLTPIGTVDPETHHWVRPENVPDITSVYNDETNTIYMVIDATGHIPDPHLSIKYSTSGNPYTVEVGSIQNGVFTATETETKSTNTVYSKTFTPAENYYPIVKISANHLRTFQLQAWTSADGHTYVAQYQPIISWIGHMEYSDSSPRTPYFTEYEKIKVDSCSGTFLQNRWQYAYNLQELDVSDLDTSSWAITNLAGTWDYCLSLPYLDVSSWNTSNWAVTNMSNTWEWCNNLAGLDLSNWDTSKWTVTNLSNTWYYCNALEYLYNEDWDVSGWAVKNLRYTWYYCYKLRYLDLHKWDTSNWAVTGSMDNTWTSDKSLEVLNISTWDTSKWTVTNLSNTWNQCCLLKSLDLNHWDTSKWAVTNLSNTWYNCWALEYLGIDSLDTSNWSVTNFNSTWSYCYKLKSLDLRNWNVSGWAVTAFNESWNACYELETLDVSTWDVSNWRVSGTMNGTWRNCQKLKRLPVENWDTSEWTVTNFNAPFGNCMMIESFPAENWDTSKWKCTTMSGAVMWCKKIKTLTLKWDISNWPLNGTDATAYPFRFLINLVTLDLSYMDISKFTTWRNSSNFNMDSCRMLQNIIFGPNNSGKLTTNATYPLIRFDWSPLLTRQSILNIFDALADGVSGKTLQLGSANLNKMTAEEKAIATNKGWTLT